MPIVLPIDVVLIILQALELDKSPCRRDSLGGLRRSPQGRQNAQAFSALRQVNRAVKDLVEAAYPLLVEQAANEYIQRLLRGEQLQCGGAGSISAQGGPAGEGSTLLHRASVLAVTLAQPTDSLRLQAILCSCHSLEHLVLHAVVRRDSLSSLDLSRCSRRLSSIKLVDAGNAPGRIAMVLPDTLLHFERVPSFQAHHCSSPTLSPAGRPLPRELPPALRSLTLRSMKLRADDVTALKLSTLLVLDLFDNELGEEGTALAALPLGESGSLRRLNVGRNDIGDLGFHLLLLRGSRTLLELDVSDNGITSLAPLALLSNTSLQTLILDANPLSWHGAADFELPSSSSLSTVSLRGIEPRVAADLVDSFRVLPQTDE